MERPTETFGEVVVVHAPKEAAGDGGRYLADKLYEPLHSGRCRLVLDLQDTEQIDSAGLTLLVELRERVRRLHGDVKLCAPRPTIRSVFEITRLDQHFEILASVSDAVKSYRRA